MIPIRRLFNGHAEWFRETTTRGLGGDVIVAWSAQYAPAGKNCRPDQAWSGVLQDSGPGEQQAGKRRWFLDRGFVGIRERDVLRIDSGPEAPVVLRVESVTPQWDRGQLHHIEVNVEVWHGDLPAVLEPEEET